MIGMNKIDFGKKKNILNRNYIKFLKMKKKIKENSDLMIELNNIYLINKILFSQ